ncbi:uncharacterized protein [Maniola hyperantus]|uniref:uncharacterized protein n=1 Tax=Aphantopus hyperantus TaxID=2795564 RepID=UPI003747C3E3
MDRLQFEFTMIASSDGKSNVLAITSISTEEGKCYVLPDELKPVIHHTYIVKMNTFSKIKNSIKKRHQSRKIWIKLDENLKKTYIDEEGNMQFSDQYLEEMSTKQPEHRDDSLQHILEKLIETTTKKENQHNLKHISEKFIIEKFTSKNPNAMQWIENFEKECERFNITKDETKIDILRLFLEKSCLDWYSSMVIKLTVNSEWKEWKDKFLETFKNQGWDMVTTALAFRYKEGLLIDYAIKKERLILDINKSIDPKTMTDLIATGLPGFILNRLNRDELNNTTDLFNEIRKYEGMIYKKNSTIRKSGTFFYKNKTNEKKPCKTCESLDKGIKYHPEESCWFKKNKNESEKLFKANNSIIEVDMNTEKKKRVSTPLIKIKLLLENKLEVSGIYDSGSQISLINSRLIKVKEKKDNVNIAYMKTVNGVKKTDGLITIKIKILDLEEEVDVYIIENEDFDDFIVGLDMIKKFKLTQNEDLRIEQKKTTNKIDMMSKDNTNEDKNIKAYAINFNEHIETQEFVSMTDHLDNEKKIEIKRMYTEI